MGPIQFFGDKRGSIKVLQKYLISFVVVVFLPGFCFGLFCFLFFCKKYITVYVKKKTTLNNFGGKKYLWEWIKCLVGFIKRNWSENYKNHKTSALLNIIVFKGAKNYYYIIFFLIFLRFFFTNDKDWTQHLVLIFCFNKTMGIQNNQWPKICEIHFYCYLKMLSA